MNDTDAEEDKKESEGNSSPNKNRFSLRKIGPLEFSELYISYRVVLPFVIGLIVGFVLALYLIQQQKLPFFLLPTPTPINEPSLSLEVKTIDGKTILPQGQEYRIPPKESVILKLTLLNSKNERDFRWQLISQSGHIGQNPAIGSEITFTPPDIDGENIAMSVCEVDKEYKCIGDGLGRVIVLRTTTE